MWKVDFARERKFELLRPVIKSEQLNMFDSERFLQSFKADKKHSPGYYHLIVPTSIQSGDLGVEEIKLPATPSTADHILTAMLQALDAIEIEVVKL